MADLAAACRRVLENGSVNENLELAKQSFTRAKNQENGELMEDSAQHFDEAIKQYTFASQKKLDQQNKAVLMLQLGKAHGFRAIATHVSPITNGLQDPVQIADYHVQQAAHYLKEYRLQAQELALPDAFEKMNKVAMNMVAQCIDVNNLRDRISLAKGLEFHLLGGEISTYNGPRLPRAQMQLYITKQYFQQAMKGLDDDGMDLGASLSEIDKLTKQVIAWRKVPKADSDAPALSGWLLCLQSANNASQALIKTAFHLQREASESPGKIQLQAMHAELADQVRYCFHRGRLLIDLAGCAEDLYKVMNGSDEFDPQGSLDLCDTLRDLQKKAADFKALGENMDAFDVLTSSGVDMEMECVCLHYLALVFGCMGLTAQCRDMHKRVVVLALSLDPSATDYNNAPPTLKRRAWFVKSQQHVKQAQDKDRAAEEQERNAKLDEIKPKLDAIKRARDDGLKPFLLHVYACHPPKNGNSLDASVEDSADVPKAKFLSMLRDYHHDKMPADADQKEKLLFEEISKYFNHFYENIYK